MKKGVGAAGGTAVVSVSSTMSRRWREGCWQEYLLCCFGTRARDHWTERPIHHRDANIIFRRKMSRLRTLPK